MWLRYGYLKLKQNAQQKHENKIKTICSCAEAWDVKMSFLAFMNYNCFFLKKNLINDRMRSDVYFDRTKEPLPTGS